MNNLLLRFLGLFLVAIALMGFLICCAGIFGVWRFKGVAEGETLALLDLASETVDSAVQGLTSTQVSLEAALESIKNLDASLKIVNVTMENSTHFFDTTYQLTSDTFPNTIRTTQKAIQAAAQSAKLVDDTLGIIAAIPLVGSGYKPDMPLSKALLEISASLDSLPGTIEGINDDILQIKGNMVDLETQIEDASGQTEQIKNSLTETNAVILKVNDLAKRLQPRLSNLRIYVPRWLNYLTWGLTIFLVWFALAQIGMIVQGMRLILEQPGLTRDEVAKPAGGHIRGAALEETKGDFSTQTGRESGEQ
jgi:hypothetical protein